MEDLKYTIIRAIWYFAWKTAKECDFEMLQTQYMEFVTQKLKTEIESYTDFTKSQHEQTFSELKSEINFAQFFNI